MAIRFQVSRWNEETRDKVWTYSFSLHVKNVGLVGFSYEEGFGVQMFKNKLYIFSKSSLVIQPAVHAIEIKDDQR